MLPLLSHIRMASLTVSDIKPSMTRHPIYVLLIELKVAAPRFDDLFVLLATVKEAEADGFVNIKPSRHRSLPNRCWMIDALNRGDRARRS